MDRLQKFHPLIKSIQDLSIINFNSLNNSNEEKLKIPWIYEVGYSFWIQYVRLYE